MLFGTPNEDPKIQKTAGVLLYDFITNKSFMQDSASEEHQRVSHDSL